jgi:hypothetical protein
MRRGARSFAVLASILAIGSIAAFAASAGATTKTKGKKDSGTAYVSIVHTVGNTEYAAGYTFDKLFGQTATTYATSVRNGPATGTVVVTVKRLTLYTSTGTLYGTGIATDNLVTGAITDGKIDVTHGTGAQKGHTFVGTLTGSEDLKTGVYTFNYTGTYK